METKNVDKVINILADEYNLDVGMITAVDDGYLLIKNGDFYKWFYVGNDIDTNLEDTASFIFNTIPEEYKVYKKSDEEILKEIDREEIVKESLSDFDETTLYRYTWTPIFTEKDDIEDYTNESKLAEISKHQPYCKIKDKLIVSKDEDDGFLVITFDIEENKDKDIPEDLLKEDYVVFESDLTPVVSSNDSDTLVDEIEIKEDVDTQVETVVENEQSDNLDMTLISALNSERDAVVTYQSLINETSKEDYKQLFQKILDDEKEHIALLSGLQSSAVASSVATDNKDLLDDYATDIIEED